MPKENLPFARQSRSRVMKTSSDPWLNIPEPTLYDSSGAPLNIPSGAFGTVARAAIGNSELPKIFGTPMPSQNDLHLAELFGTPILSQNDRHLAELFGTPF
ncbi:hypothetical protein [Prochlorothrix hollandica]|uniref:hypothetical protein n=1 Tax=Prochlorothrix hollandica TaxID=1223 RepID=UPI0011D1B9F6|nr:hypothetical protein [Prochlorothrix hollandica]